MMLQFCEWTQKKYISYGFTIDYITVEVLFVGVWTTCNISPVKVEL